MEFLSGLDSHGHIADVNVRGDVCGWSRRKVKANGNKYNYYETAYRYDSQVMWFTELAGAYAITGHGDLILYTTAASARYLHHEGTGLILLDDVLTGSDADRASWFNSSAHQIRDMTERGALNPDAPDYPGICGSLALSNGGYRAFLLTPVPAP